MSVLSNDTISAIATGMTPSGIGIVRMSGENVFRVLSKIFRSKNPEKHIETAASHTIHYGYIYDGENLIDEVLVMIMHSPHTYTGENTVEIDCHGGILAVRRVLETTIAYGARPAEPGEFTKRAFLNGKMDLSKAEAVADLINAKNEYARKSSLGQLQGSVERKIREIREELLYYTAFIESALDDPEHISLDGFQDQLLAVVRKNEGRIQKLLDTCEEGKMIREGIRTVITGKPNVGKSSLLNVLIGEEKAIVTRIAGTTRDALEEQIILGGISLCVADTAGIRQTNETVEKIGVDKARKYAREADLILYVVDSSQQLDNNDEEIIQLIREENKKAIVLLNKSDLDPVLTPEQFKTRLSVPVLEISAKEKTGMEELENCIREMFFHGEISFNDEVYITNIRHKNALQKALNSLSYTEQSILEGLPEDFYTIDLTDAWKSLGFITGESTDEELVNEIFSKFCMGK